MKNIDKVNVTEKEVKYVDVDTSKYARNNIQLEVLLYESIKKLNKVKGLGTRKRVDYNDGFQFPERISIRTSEGEYVFKFSDREIIDNLC